MSERGRPIVVGTDGSAATRADVREAAALARHDGVDLHIVGSYAMADDSAHRALRVGAPADIVHELSGRGEALLDVDEARQMVSEVHDLVIHTHVCRGSLRHAVTTVAEAVRGAVVLTERRPTRRRLVLPRPVLSLRGGPARAER